MVPELDDGVKEELLELCCKALADGAKLELLSVEFAGGKGVARFGSEIEARRFARLFTGRNSIRAEAHGVEVRIV